MSLFVDVERSEDTFHRQLERAKQVLRELADVNRCTAEGLTISQTSRRLAMSRPKVRFMRRVLQWDSWSKSPSTSKLAFRTNRIEVGCEA